MQIVFDLIGVISLELVGSLVDEVKSLFALALEIFVDMLYAVFGLERGECQCLQSCRHRTSSPQRLWFRFCMSLESHPSAYVSVP